MKCSECGKEIDSSTAFCCCRGRDLKATETFSHNIEDTIISYHENIKKPRSPLLTNFKALLKKKQKVMVTALITALILFCTIAGIESLNANRSKNYINDVDFVLMLKTQNKNGLFAYSDETGDLYQSLPGKENLKLATGVFINPEFAYIIDSHHDIKYLYINKDRVLCEINQAGAANEICPNAAPYSVTTSVDLKNYLFTTLDGKVLYVKYSGKEKQKVADNVLQYYFLSDNETYVYTDDTNTMFMKDKNTPAVEVGKNIRMCNSNSSCTLLTYVDTNNKMYYMDIKSREVKEIGTFQLSPAVFDDKSGMWYLSNNNLYYMNTDVSKSIKIAENVQEFSIDEDMVTYLDTENNVYYKLNTDSQPIRLADASQSIEAFHSGSFIIYEDRDKKLFKLDIKNGARKQIYHIVDTLWKKDGQVYFKSPTGMLFQVDKSGNASKIAQGVRKFNIIDSADISYLTDENDLYLKDRLIRDVSDYFPSGNNVLYRNSKGELYIVEGKSEPRKVCDNIADYTAIYYGDPTGHFLQNILMR